MADREENPAGGVLIAVKWLSVIAKQEGTFELFPSE